MRHPTEGTIRRLLDEPAGVADPDREHVAGCLVCRSALAAAERDAATARAALDVEAGADVDAAWRRLTHDLAVDVRTRPAAPPVRRWRTRLRSPAVAVVGVLAILSGAGAAAAADWLQVFRTERIAPVPLTEADLVELPDLSAYGTLEIVREADVRSVADAAAAERATGLPAPQVDDLPRGVTGVPAFTVGREVRAEFTFSAEQAADAAADAGEPLPPPPPGLDGNRFRLRAGPGLAAVWSEARGLPALVVARAVAPTADSTGVPFETARDYLLSLPGLPDDVAAQLRRFSADGTTLPLPVPAEQLRTSTADVGGVSATVLTTRDGALAAVVWVDDGVVTAVAGSLTEDEVLAVARGLGQR